MDKTQTYTYIHSHLVVDTLRAVEDDALLGEGFGQILDGLRLPCACWPGWSPTQVQLEGTHQTQVAAVLGRERNIQFISSESYL